MHHLMGIKCNVDTKFYPYSEASHAMVIDEYAEIRS